MSCTHKHIHTRFDPGWDKLCCGCCCAVVWAVVFPFSVFSCSGRWKEFTWRDLQLCGALALNCTENLWHNIDCSRRAHSHDVLKQFCQREQGQFSRLLWESIRSFCHSRPEYFSFVFQFGYLLVPLLHLCHSQSAGDSPEGHRCCWWCFSTVCGNTLSFNLETLHFGKHH